MEMKLLEERRKRRRPWSFFRLCLVVVAVIVRIAAVSAQSSDFYQILGVSKRATEQEVKKAYRKKARDTHPDKSDLPPEEAAANFHTVVEAFEVLSDPQSRRYYDQTGRKPGERNNFGSNNGNRQHHQQQWSWSWSFNGQRTHTNFQHRTHRQQYRPQKLKDKPMVKRAQARLMHIVSLEQFQTVLLDDEHGEFLDRHVLLAAVNPQLEQHVMEEMVFPFPFAGMSPQNIWWEDVLQTVLIRYHSSNALTQALNLPKGSDITEPIFLFGKKGQRISDRWERIVTNNRQQLEKWVWNRISVKMIFENHHDHPVEVYWIDGTSAKIKIPRLEPGEQSTHYSHLTHEWYIRDLRVDNWKDSPGRWKLTGDSMLLTFKLTQPQSPFVMKIPPRKCFDLSGHCGFWAGQNECHRNPNFMNDKCPLTCKRCDDTEERIWTEQAKNGTYVPLTEKYTAADENEDLNNKVHEDENEGSGLPHDEL